MHELPAGAMHTADGVAELPQVVVKVTTPEGALSDRRRAELTKELTRMILDATGWDDDAALRIWILNREIDEGSWGAGRQRDRVRATPRRCEDRAREGRGRRADP